MTFGLVGANAFELGRFSQLLRGSEAELPKLKGDNLPKSMGHADSMIPARFYAKAHPGPHSESLL